MTNPGDAYVFSGRAAEAGRLVVQAALLEPAGRRLLAELPPAPPAARALDLGCGALGWLRLLHEWVGEGGEVVGTDVGADLLAHARALVDREGLSRARLAQDDLFDSRLPPASFDLVHARFLLTPLGRAEEQMRAYLRLVKPGGLLVVEEPIGSTTTFARPTPATFELAAHFNVLWQQSGGDLEIGKRLPALFRGVGLEARLRADVALVPPGHPYNENLLHVFEGVAPRLRARLGDARFEALLERAREELTDERQWGTTSVLVQAWARVPEAR